MSSERKTAQAKAIAKNLGLKWQTIKPSTRKGKRFMIKGPNDEWIHFGQWPYNRYGTFLDHQDEKIRKAWMARHSKIMKDGKPAYMDPTSPEYYSWLILW